jgi:hypothetical protein
MQHLPLTIKESCKIKERRKKKAEKIIKIKKGAAAKVHGQTNFTAVTVRLMRFLNYKFW